MPFVYLLGLALYRNRRCCIGVFFGKYSLCPSAYTNTYHQKSTLPTDTFDTRRNFRKEQRLPLPNILQLHSLDRCQARSRETHTIISNQRNNIGWTVLKTQNQANKMVHGSEYLQIDDVAEPCSRKLAESFCIWRRTGEICAVGSGTLSILGVIILR